MEITTKERYNVCSYCCHRTETPSEAIAHAYACMPHRPMYREVDIRVVEPTPSAVSDPHMNESRPTSGYERELAPYMR